MPLLGTRGAASAQGFGEFAQSAAPVYIEDVFSTYLYTGNGGAQTITNGIDVKTKGGLIWAKSRSGADDHRLWDTARGGWLISNSTGGSQAPSININNTNTYMYATTSGFAYGVDSGTGVGNDNGTTYASWTFRKQPKFFDIVTFSTDSSGNATVSHSLGSTPGCILIKRTNGSQDWKVYHRSLNVPTGRYLELNSISAEVNPSQTWISVSSTTISFPGTILDSSSNFVAYLFAHDAGGFGTAGTDNVISCGSFTTDGSGFADINLGYEAQWALVKKSSSTGSWAITDNMRGWVTGAALNTSDDAVLFPNVTNAETTQGRGYPTATGFSYADSASSTYIYIAIRRGPMKTPTTGASVFEPAFSTSGSPEYKSNTVISGFDSAIAIYRPGYSGGSFSYPFVATRLIGQPYVLFTSNTNVQYSYSTAVTFAFNTGWFTGTFGNDTNREAYMFKRAPGFHDVVAYSGTGVTAWINHNLTVPPELIILKNRTVASGWLTYAAPLGADKYLQVNSTAGSTTSTIVWDNTTPTSTQFRVYNGFNNSGYDYVGYLFASCPGVSKVGSYSGTGANQTIDCGFASGVRWVLIKRTDTTGDWYVYDTTRGMTSGNDPYILLNSVDPEVTGTNYVETIATGFRLIGSNAGTNANGGNYIYLAIA